MKKNKEDSRKRKKLLLVISGQFIDDEVWNSLHYYHENRGLPKNVQVIHILMPTGIDITCTDYDFILRKPKHEEVLDHPVTPKKKKKDEANKEEQQ